MNITEEKNRLYRTENPLLSKEKKEEMSCQIPQRTLEDKEIKREFDFESFRKAVDFVNKVAEVAKKKITSI